jgi:hypothetical protein
MRAETMSHTRSPGLKRSGVALVALLVAVAISAVHIWMNSFGNVSTLFAERLPLRRFRPALRPRLADRRCRLGTRTRCGRSTSPSARPSRLPRSMSSMAENAIYDRGVRLIWSDWLAGALCILGALEFTRRTTGWIIPVLIALALSYVVWWGQYVPGVFRFGGLSAETVLFRALYGDDAMFGTIARISSTYVFMFILFGAFLLKSGAGDFIVDMARAVAGR